MNPLVWKQWRESRPLFAAWLVVWLVVIVWYAVILRIDSRNWSRAFPDVDIWGTVANDMRNFTMVSGVLVAVVVGIGGYVSDLQPKLFAFWKSRPISVSLWFWIKYVTGAALVLLFLQGPPAALDVFALGEINESYLACSPLLHLLAYTVAVCVICLVRQAVYAGILATGLTMAMNLLPELWPRLQHFPFI